MSYLRTSMPNRFASRRRQRRTGAAMVRPKHFRDLFENYEPQPNLVLETTIPPPVPLDLIDMNTVIENNNIIM